MKSEVLKSYLDSISFEGTAKPDLETLRQITTQHTKTYPFEGLNPFLGIRIHLDENHLIKKFVEGRRGGYCFEQNGLLLFVLKSIGYQVRGLLGKVFHKGETLNNVVRTHMVLLVDIDEQEYIADVGCGSFVPTVPLKFNINQVQITPTGEEYRILPEREHFYLQIRKDQEWNTIYLFDLQEQYAPDYKVANWYTETHPDSIFVNNLMASIVSEKARLGLRNNQLTIRPFGGKKETKILGSLTELKAILRHDFKLNLDELPNLDQKLQTLIDQSKAGA